MDFRGSNELIGPQGSTNPASVNAHNDLLSAQADLERRKAANYAEEHKANIALTMAQSGAMNIATQKAQFEMTHGEYLRMAGSNSSGAGDYIKRVDELKKMNPGATLDAVASSPAAQKAWQEFKVMNGPSSHPDDGAPEFIQNLRKQHDAEIGSLPGDSSAETYQRAHKMLADIYKGMSALDAQKAQLEKMEKEADIAHKQAQAASDQAKADFYKSGGKLQGTTKAIKQSDGTVHTMKYNPETGDYDLDQGVQGDKPAAGQDAQKISAMASQIYKQQNLDHMMGKRKIPPSMTEAATEARAALNSGTAQAKSPPDGAQNQDASAYWISKGKDPATVKLLASKGKLPPIPQPDEK